MYNLFIYILKKSRNRLDIKNYLLNVQIKERIKKKIGTCLLYSFFLIYSNLIYKGYTTRHRLRVNPYPSATKVLTVDIPTHTYMLRLRLRRTLRSIFYRVRVAGGRSRRIRKNKKSVIVYIKRRTSGRGFFVYKAGCESNR